MPDFNEISEADASHLSNGSHLIESKIDGFCTTWVDDQLLSERDIDRKDRFPHIIAELRQLPWSVQGETAVPFGNVLSVNKRENWPDSRFYVFDLKQYQGTDIIADPFDVRRELEKIFKKHSFKHLRLPFKWDDFNKAVAWTKRKDGEGLVFKPANCSRGLKWKNWKELKVPILGHVPGKVKGKFRLLCPGNVEGSVSGTSVGYIEKYEKILAQGKDVWVEIQYLFLTDNGIPFQPILRRLGTKDEILAKGKK